MDEETQPDRDDERGSISEEAQPKSQSGPTKDYLVSTQALIVIVIIMLLLVAALALTALNNWKATKQVDTPITPTPSAYPSLEVKSPVPIPSLSAAPVETLSPAITSSISPQISSTP